MKYSLAKIAQELGVSKTTVSLILSGKAKQFRISPETEKTVIDFCQKINYVPNIHAQRMNEKYVKNVGLLIDKNMLADEENPFTDPNISEITGGVVLAAEAEGYRVTIQVYKADQEEDKIFEWFYNHEIDGLIYYGLNFPNSWVNLFAEKNYNVVGIGVKPCMGISSVNINNYELIRELTQKLVTKGNKKLVFIDGVKHSYVSQERKRAFLSVLPEGSVYEGCFSEKKAYELVTNLIKGNAEIDGIICANDNMAIGAITALNVLGVKCPKEVAVTGADNIKISRYVNPALTTIDNKNTELGKLAFNVLLKKIKGIHQGDKIINSEVIYRQTT